MEERMINLHDCHLPKTASQLRRFLGMLKFYRRFLSYDSATQAPLHNVLSGPRVKVSHPTGWKPELLKIFGVYKASLSRTTPGPSEPLALVTDASTSVIGTALQPRVMNVWQVLAFSKTQPGSAVVQRLRPRATGHLRGRKAFPPYSGSASLHHLHRPQAFQQKRVRCSSSSSII
jgi:hypothetical protein